MAPGALIEESRNLIQSRTLCTPLLQLCASKHRWVEALSLFHTILSSGGETGECYVPTVEACVTAQARWQDSLRILQLANVMEGPDHPVMSCKLATLSPAEEFDLSTTSMVSVSHLLDTTRKLTSSANLRSTAYTKSIFRLCEGLLTGSLLRDVHCSTPGQQRHLSREESDSSKRLDHAASLDCPIQFLCSYCGLIDDILGERLAEVFELSSPLKFGSLASKLLTPSGDTLEGKLKRTIADHAKRVGATIAGNPKAYTTRVSKLNYIISPDSVGIIHKHFTEDFSGKKLLIPDSASLLRNYSQVISQSQWADIVLTPTVLMELGRIVAHDAPGGEASKKRLRSQIRSLLSSKETIPVRVFSLIEELATQSSNYISAQDGASEELLDLSSPSARIAMTAKCLQDCSSTQTNPANVSVKSTDPELRKLAKFCGVPIATVVR